MKNFFQKHWLLLVVLIVAVGNFGIYYDINEPLKDIKYLWAIVFLVELMLFYSFIFKTIISPIHDLKLEIAKFLTWWKKWEQLDIVKSSNPALQYIINFFNKSLEILKNFKEEMRTGKELKSEVQLASEIQKNTLEKHLPIIPSIDIVANTKSASEVWWDSYDVIKRGENYYIYLWDVTWHWVASWFVMMMVNALVSGFSKIKISSSEILANTNEILKPRVPSNMLMTLLMVRWNEEEKKLYMTWAWHEYLLVYKKSQNKAFKIKSWWLALGMTKDISKVTKESQIWIEEWDIIIMYTDWITEARNTNKEDGLMFWVDRLVEVIENTSIKTAQWVFNSITIELSRWMWYNHRQFDDITLITMHYKWNKEVEKVHTDIPKENITEWKWK